MKIPRKTTITDIARASGVSVSTISRVLNNSPDVAERTRHRVLRLIDEMGYAPSAHAQQLAAGRSRAITILFHREYGAFTMVELEFLTGAAIACYEENYYINLNASQASPDNIVSLYENKQVDGVLLMEIYFQDKRVEQLRKHRYPFVMIGREEYDKGLNFIDFDFDASVRKVFDYLYQNGHRYIGFLGYPLFLYHNRYNPAVRTRRAYDKIQEEYSLPRIYTEVDMSQEKMTEATHQLLDRFPQMTAIISFNGDGIVGVLKAIQVRGLHVPEDISVVGLSTAHIAQLMIPSLTSIEQQTQQTGYEAAKALIRILEKGQREDYFQKLIAPELCIRESSGPARST